MATAIDFRQKLQYGQIGESIITSYMRSLDWTVLPVYEKEIDTGKGPRIYTAFRSGLNELVATDMLTLRGEEIRWVEAKRKTNFSWYYKRGVWQDGIDLRHYEDYLRVRKHTNLPLWILFLHQNSQPADRDIANGCPSECPTGLYGREITILEKLVSHKDSFKSNGRNYPMVYWDIEHLMPKGKPIATLPQIFASLKQAQSRQVNPNITHTQGIEKARNTQYGRHSIERKE